MFLLDFDCLGCLPAFLERPATGSLSKADLGRPTFLTTPVAKQNHIP